MTGVAIEENTARSLLRRQLETLAVPNMFLTTETLHLGVAIQETETVKIALEIGETKSKSKHVPRFHRAEITPHVSGALRLLVFTGMRVSEVLNIE